MARPRTLPGALFRLTLGGGEPIALFREVSGFDSETDVIEHREGGDLTVRRLPGMHKPGNITLKRGLDSSLELWQWRKKVIDQGADQARVDGTIELLDAQGTAVVTIGFRQGWPIKYSILLDASTGGVAMEVVEIAHEGFQRQ